MNETKLLKYLKESEELKKIVGARILPNKLEKNIRKPAIVYFKYGRSKKRQYNNGGELTERFQLDVYSESYKQSKEIEKVLIKLLDGVEGTLGNSITFVTDVKDLYQNDLDKIIVEVEIKNL